MSWITDALWITESVDKLWHAYRDGLTLSCPVHHDAVGSDDEREEDVLRATVAEPGQMIRGFH